MAGTAISYNSLSLQSDTYRVQKIEHVEMPKREINRSSRARTNGESYISGWFGARRIKVTGAIVCSTAAALLTALDALQAALNSDGANLDIEYGSGTRRYASAVVETQDIPKEGYHYSFVPFTLIFYVPDGVGKDTAATTVTESGKTASPFTKALTLTGSADQLPVITLTFASATTATVLKVKNDTTGEEMVIGPSAASFAASDVVEIDCENMTVKLNGVSKDYTGIFPRWLPGANTLRVTVTAVAFNLGYSFVYYPRYL